jgi:hypothetical protein
MIYIDKILSEKIYILKAALDKTEALIIGAGAGLSATASTPSTKPIFTSSPLRKSNMPIGSGLSPPYAITSLPENPTLIYTASSRTKTMSSLPPIQMGSFLNQVLIPVKSASPRGIYPTSNAQNPVPMNYTRMNRQ